MFSTVVRRENWLSDKLSFATGQDFLLLQVQGNIGTNYHQHFLLRISNSSRRSVEGMLEPSGKAGLALLPTRWGGNKI